jgi:hypothetical protein
MSTSIMMMMVILMMVVVAVVIVERLGKGVEPIAESRAVEDWQCAKSMFQKGRRMNLQRGPRGQGKVQRGCCCGSAENRI